MGKVAGALMVNQGDVISYLDMCREEGVNLQRGMNFRLKGGFSVILMSLRTGAPYADRIEDDGRVLIYEGHDVPKNVHHSPKSVDQQFQSFRGTITENGKFFQAADEYTVLKRQKKILDHFEAM